MTKEVEKLIQWKVWTERFSVLIIIGLLPIGLFILYWMIYYGIDVLLQLGLGLLCIILALFGIYFDIQPIFDFYHKWFDLFPLFYSQHAPLIPRLGLLLAFIGVVSWVFTLVGYKRIKRSFLKSTETEDALINSLVSHVQNKNYGKYGTTIITILGDIGGKRATASIIIALKDGDLAVRTQAAVVLGEIGDATAVESLNQALEDKDEAVREAVEVALEKIKGREAETDNRTKSGDMK